MLGEHKSRNTESSSEVVGNSSIRRRPLFVNLLLVLSVLFRANKTGSTTSSMPGRAGATSCTV